MTGSEEPPASVFPVFKKRNITGLPSRKRRRVEADENETSTEHAPTAAVTTDSADTATKTHSNGHDAPAQPEELEGVVRRPGLRAKRSGIDINTTRAGSVTMMENLNSDAETTEATLGAPVAAYGRFVAPMDMSKASWRDDPHTLAYVERTLAERKNSDSAPASPSIVPSVEPQEPRPSEPPRPHAKQGAQPYWYKMKSGAAAGKLEEVDLGAANTARNVERTQAALQRLSTTGSATPPRRVFAKERRREEKRRARLTSEERQREERAARIRAQLDTYLAQEDAQGPAPFPRFQLPDSDAGPDAQGPAAAGDARDNEARLKEMFRKAYEFEQDRVEPVPERRVPGPPQMQQQRAKEQAPAQTGPKMGGSRNLRRLQAEEAKKRP